MKTKNLLFTAMASIFFITGANAQNVNIPDAIFKTYLVNNTAINTNGDNEIQVSEASAFNGKISCIHKNITNLTGIEAFTALTKLECSYNQLKRLDVSKNSSLTDLSCAGNQLKRLDVSKNTSLTALWCEGNKFDCAALISKYGIENPTGE